MSGFVSKQCKYMLFLMCFSEFSFFTYCRYMMNTNVIRRVESPKWCLSKVAPRGSHEVGLCKITLIACIKHITVPTASLFFSAELTPLIKADLIRVKLGNWKDLEHFCALPPSSVPSRLSFPLTARPIVLPLLSSLL